MQRVDMVEDTEKKEKKMLEAISKVITTLCSTVLPDQGRIDNFQLVHLGLNYRSSVYSRRKRSSI
jgi:hypothetical protein